MNGGVDGTQTSGQEQQGQQAGQAAGDEQQRQQEAETTEPAYEEIRVALVGLDPAGAAKADDHEMRRWREIAGLEDEE